MSSLPRSGRLLVCPKCRAVVPGELGVVLYGGASSGRAPPS